MGGGGSSSDAQSFKTSRVYENPPKIHADDAIIIALRKPGEGDHNCSIFPECCFR